MKLNKKGQYEDWLVHVIFYAAMIVVLLVISWLLYTGKFTTIWENIVSKMRFR